MLATALVGALLRTAARQLVEEEFENRIEAAGTAVSQELAWEAETLRRLVTPLCEHDMFVGRTHAALERARGDAGVIERDTGSWARDVVSDQARALRLDDLVLIAGDGTVLGASDVSRVGTREPELAALIRRPATVPTLRNAKEGAPDLMEAHCLNDSGGVAVGLVGSRRIGVILDRIGQAYRARLSVAGGSRDSAKGSEDVAVRVLNIDAVRGLRVLAAVPRDEVILSLQRLDRYILVGGSTTIVVALIIAIGLARSLSEPIAELSHETREVVSGAPKHVRVRGSKEIRLLAQTLNTAIDELTAMRKRLAATERISARREVARQIAHEIKNPLAPIRAAVETLRRLRDRDDPAFHVYFDEATATVLGEVHRIANIVTQFTRFNRMPPPSPEPMDLVEVARSVVNFHAARLESTVSPCSRPPAVELAATDIPLVAADRDQMIQVLTNLVQNGLEAAGATRADPRVLVTVGPESDGRVRIVVRDNGPGVPEAFLPRLFEPYATTKVGGTGLGLAIVQRIVFEHGGEIAYRKAQKGGAVFEIILPIGGPPLLERPPTIDGSPRTGTTPSADDPRRPP
jgi:signal transduction histidine kinase